MEEKKPLRLAQYYANKRAAELAAQPPAEPALDMEAVQAARLSRIQAAAPAPKPRIPSLSDAFRATGETSQ